MSVRQTEIVEMAMSLDMAAARRTLTSVHTAQAKALRSRALLQLHYHHCTHTSITSIQDLFSARCYGDTLSNALTRLRGASVVACTSSGTAGSPATMEGTLHGSGAGLTSDGLQELQVCLIHRESLDAIHLHDAIRRSNCIHVTETS